LETKGKLNLARLVIKKAIMKFGDDAVVSCSFGKDSLLTLALVRELKPNIRVLFSNTLNEFPETIQLRDRLRRDWGLEILETRPWKEMTYRKCLDRWGLPKVRLKGTPRCCWYLKERPAIALVEKENLKCLITGLTMAESRNRFLTGKRFEGCNQEHDGLMYTRHFWFSKIWNCWKFHPLQDFRLNEVWSLSKQMDLPINEVYLKWEGIYKRVGCLMCTAYCGWKEKLRVSHPRIYEWLLTFETVPKI